MSSLSATEAAIVFEAGKRSHPRGMRVAKIDHLKRWCKIKVDEKIIRRDIERLVMLDYLTCKKLERGNASELIFVLLPKGQHTYEMLCKDNARLAEQ